MNGKEEGFWSGQVDEECGDEWEKSLSTGLGKGLSNGLVVGPKGNWSSLSIADSVRVKLPHMAYFQQ